MSELLTRLRAEPVRASRYTTGILTTWYVTVGDTVAKYTPLGVVESDGLETEITAPLAGIVHTLAAPGQRVESGMVLAYLEPSEPRPRVRRQIVAGRGEPVTLATPSTPVEPPIVVEPPTPPTEPAEKRSQSTTATPQRRRRPRVVKLTTHPLDSQRDALKELASSMRERHGYSESELHRVAFNWLLSLQETEITELVEQQRDKEQSGYYGFGARPIG